MQKLSRENGVEICWKSYQQMSLRVAKRGFQLVEDSVQLSWNCATTVAAATATWQTSIKIVRYLNEADQATFSECI